LSYLTLCLLKIISFEARRLDNLKKITAITDW